MNRRQFLGRSLSLGAAVPVWAQTSGGRRLQAGAAASNISPALGVTIAGNMTYSPASEIHDELHVRSLVLDNGQTRLAFAVVDSCMVPGDIIAEAKQLIEKHTGIAPSHTMVSATHTHSAPAAMHLFQSEADPKYTEWLPGRIADSVRLAANRLRPARIGWGVGREERYVHCRRFFMKPEGIVPDPFGRRTDVVRMNPGAGNPHILRPEGPADPDLGVIVVETAEGEPICAVGNYALHYIGGVRRGDISADYFSVWADSLARMAGLTGANRRPPFVGIMTNACSGHSISIDARNPSTRKYAPYEKMQEVGDVLAAEALRTWRTMEFHHWVELSASQEELELGVRLPSAEEVAVARQMLAEAPRKDGQVQERPHIYARETVYLADYPARVKTVVQGLRIGSLGIATFPGEAFAELGLEVKARSPFRTTMLIELANDARGYLPTVEAHKNGGYETWRAKSSYLEVEAAPKMVAAALRRLQELAG
jgi:neutral ceramidase